MNDTNAPAPPTATENMPREIGDSPELHKKLRDDERDPSQRADAIAATRDRVELRRAAALEAARILTEAVAAATERLADLRAVIDERKGDPLDNCTVDERVLFYRLLNAGRVEDHSWGGDLEPTVENRRAMVPRMTLAKESIGRAISLIGYPMDFTDTVGWGWTDPTAVLQVLAFLKRAEDSLESMYTSAICDLSIDQVDTDLAAAGAPAVTINTGDPFDESFLASVEDKVLPAFGEDVVVTDDDGATEPAMQLNVSRIAEGSYVFSLQKKAVGYVLCGDDDRVVVRSAAIEGPQFIDVWDREFITVLTDLSRVGAAEVTLEIDGLMTHANVGETVADFPNASPPGRIVFAYVDTAVVRWPTTAVMKARFEARPLAACRRAPFCQYSRAEVQQILRHHRDCVGPANDKAGAA